MMIMDSTTTAITTTTAGADVTTTTTTKTTFSSQLIESLSLNTMMSLPSSSSSLHDDHDQASQGLAKLSSSQSSTNLRHDMELMEVTPVKYMHQLIETMTNEIINMTSELVNHHNLNASANMSDDGIEHGEDDGMGYVPYIERPETYIVPVLFAIIFIIGVLGNGVLILIFLRHRTMRNVPNMYICSLAIGDILVIFFCVPFTSTVYTVESWPYGLLVCKFSEFIKDVSIGVSVFTLTALSADRYFAIVDPMRKLTGCRATRVTCITIIGIWILSIVLALPSVLFSYIRIIDEESPHSFQVCYPFPPELGNTYPKIIVMFKFLVYYAIPLVFIATFYIIMAHHLVLSTKDMPGEIHGQTKQIQARKKVAKMVLSFVVIFAICFFPSHVFLLWFYYNPNSEENFNAFWNFVRIIGFCLGFINSCINPITLYCLSGTFRKHFNQNLFCCLSRQERHHPRARNLLACGACVSMSNSAHVNGGGHGISSTDNRNHRFGRGGAGNGYGGGGMGMYRGTTTMTGTGRKCTWDSSQHQTHQPSILNHHRQILVTNLATVPIGIGGTEALMLDSINIAPTKNGHHPRNRFNLSRNKKSPQQSPKLSSKENDELRDSIEVCSSPLLKTANGHHHNSVKQLSLENLTMMTSFINTNPLNGSNHHIESK